MSAIHIQASSLGDPSQNVPYVPSFKKISVDLTFLRRTPTSITIHPVSLFSILDHYLRRTDAQDRVIGTLLGIHNDNEVEVRSSFAVLHSETDEQVAVDTDYHQTMYDLHHKVNPKEVIVGWLVLFFCCFSLN
jgi:translation initiation factor 3 subunit F